MAVIKFTDNSPQVIAALNEQAIRGLEECGLLGESYAKENITKQKAVDTGNLRNSISHKVVENEAAVYIGTDVEYAPYIEFGTGVYAEEGGRQTPWAYEDANGDWHRTSGMEARPYLRPAVTDHQDQYNDILKEALKD